jgi:hypothetical protein
LQEGVEQVVQQQHISANISHKLFNVGDFFLSWFIIWYVLCYRCWISTTHAAILQQIIGSKIVGTCQQNSAQKAASGQTA